MSNLNRQHRLFKDYLSAMNIYRTPNICVATLNTTIKLSMLSEKITVRNKKTPKKQKTTIKNSSTPMIYISTNINNINNSEMD